ncbi:VWA domain-containing protein [Mycoplasmatota bacterium]|nr:VWA domain-containing protein [Mycoplasmatota bacterium]
MNEQLTEMIFILDRSGSMAGLEEDTIGGFNSLIDKQKKLEGQAKVSTVLFNHETSVLHDQLDIRYINSMTLDKYYVGGSTALLVAVGSSIRHIRRVYAETLKEERPSKVVFVITTDGMENCSKNYSYKTVKSMIEETKKKYDWEYIFLGANINAIDEARKFGIHSDRAAKYHSNKIGTKKNYEAIDEAITSLRMTNTMKSEWKKKIDEDYKSRK